MDSLKHRAMDVFRYAFPGILLIFVFTLTISEVKTAKDILEKLMPMIDLKSGILLLFIGYFLGFCIDPIGRQLRYRIAEKIWETPERGSDGRDLNHSDRYVLIRQFSEGNYSLIETWDMLKGMACNFAVGTLCLIIILIFKIYQNYPNVVWEWLRLIPAALILTFLLLYQTRNFERWSVNDMNSTIKMLNLEERAKQINEAKKS